MIIHFLNVDKKNGMQQLWKISKSTVKKTTSAIWSLCNDPCFIPIIDFEMPNTKSLYTQNMSNITQVNSLYTSTIFHHDQ